MMALPMLSIAELATSHRYLGLNWSVVTILGLIGNLVFSSSFIIQWLESEKRGTSVVPVSFWYLSIIGSVIMCTYFVIQRDPVGILAYLPNSMIYFRNLHLIRKQALASAGLPYQTL